MSPVVPRLKGQSIDQEAMPGPRVTVSADEETFGGGAANKQVVSAASNLNTTMQSVLANQKLAADEVKAQDADLQYGILQNRIEGDVRKMQGVNAGAAPEYVKTEWEKGVAEIEKNLKMSPDQLSYVRKYKYARSLQLNGSAQDHMSAQFDKHDTDSTNAYIANARNTAAMNAGDPDKVKVGILQQETAFRKFAARKGYDDEQIKAGVADLKSDTHVSVIDSLISSKDFDKAEQYLKANKKEIVGEAAKRFDMDYVKAQKRQAQEIAKYEQEQTYDNNLHKALIDDTEGNLSFSEIYRRWRNGEIKDSDYKYFEKRMKDPEETKWNREAAGASPDFSVFNDIRQSQLSGKYTQGQIDRMITSSKGLSGPDKDYLLKQKVSVQNDPKDQRVAVAAKSVEDFGNRYISKSGWFGLPDSKKKDAEVQSLVADFYKRVDKENADGERLNEIMKDVVWSHAKKNMSGLERLEDAPHITIGIDHKIKRLFNPGTPTKTKAAFTITRNKIQATQEKKKK